MRTAVATRILRTPEQLLRRAHTKDGNVRLRIDFEIANPDYPAASPSRTLRLPGTAINLRLRSPDVALTLRAKIAELVTQLERTGQFPSFQ